ncbi:GNAT family N-acetyltransferase [Agromyces agglutinans]|nr:GNAT family N-acetyltransferase [Agromyces agglutinans]
MHHGSTSTRLRFRPLDPSDLDAVHAIYADPETWRHLPQGRHRSPEMTAGMIARSEASRREHGLGTWAVLAPAEPDGEPVLVGTAGVTMLGFPAWNLGYRFAPGAWGRGYATEAAAAALAAARTAHPEVPVTARVLAGNPASVRVLERIGLELRWRGRSAETPEGDGRTTHLERLVFTDRPVDADLLERLIALG